MKLKKRIIILLLILTCIVFFSACQSKNNINEDSNEESFENSSPLENEGDALEDTSVEQEAELVMPAQIYDFYDEAIQYAAERFLGKSASEFTDEDFEYLSGLQTFSFDAFQKSITSLRDIPELFGNLRYIGLAYSWFDPVQLSETDITILNEMPHLQAVDIYANGLPTLEFAHKLPYASIRYSVEAYESGDNNLATASVLGKEFIESYFEGYIREYVKVTDGLLVYELIVADSQTQMQPDDVYYIGSYDAKVFISEYRNGIYYYLNSYPINGRTGTVSGGLILADVDFDGNRDILMSRGHFGNQGFVTYSCYLKRDDTYIINESFSSIWNPSIDVSNRKVLSTWRNSAASHSWAMYSFINGEYVETERLTTEPEYRDEMSDEYVWRITIKRFSDDVAEAEYFFSNEYSIEEWDLMFFHVDSYWGLRSEKWRTLYNQGTLLDWSIYGSGLDAQIIEILG